MVKVPPARPHNLSSIRETHMWRESTNSLSQTVFSEACVHYSTAPIQTYTDTQTHKLNVFKKCPLPCFVCTLSSSSVTLSQHLINSLIWFILSGSEILFVVKSEPGFISGECLNRKEALQAAGRQHHPPATVHSCKGVSLTSALQPHLILRISPGNQLPGAPSKWLHHIALQGSYGAKACCPLVAAGMGLM